MAYCRQTCARCTDTAPVRLRLLTWIQHAFLYLRSLPGLVCRTPLLQQTCVAITNLPCPKKRNLHMPVRAIDNSPPGQWWANRPPGGIQKSRKLRTDYNPTCKRRCDAGFALIWLFLRMGLQRANKSPWTCRVLKVVCPKKSITHFLFQFRCKCLAHSRLRRFWISSKWLHRSELHAQ